MALKDKSGKYENLSREELARIEERFQRRSKLRSGDAKRPVAVGPFPRRMMIMLIIVAIVLVAVMVSFGPGRANAELPPPLPQGDPAPQLGDLARLPPQCRDVTEAHFAYLPGLAEGSLSAQAAQRTTVEVDHVPLEIENSVGMRFRLIPAGSFIMGSPVTEVGRATDEQEHVQALARPYYLGKFEVTQRQWQAVMGGAASNPSAFRTSLELPVESVTWGQAVQFCRKLSELEGQPIGTYRLPTEVEWEYACRAGTQTPYSFDNTGNRFRQYSENDFRTTQPVGQLQPNAFGLYDMHGNVWEWCSNHFYNYTTGELDKQMRSLRGGMWRTPDVDCRSAVRYRYTPTSSGYVLGLRVLRVINPRTLRSARSVAAAEEAAAAAAAASTPETLDAPEVKVDPPVDVVAPMPAPATSDAPTAPSTAPAETPPPPDAVATPPAP